MGARKGQAWSIDLMIGVLVFLLAIGTIYSLMNSKIATDPEPLRIESEVIATVLTSNTSNTLLQVADENQLSMENLMLLATESELDYDTLKEQLGVENEFCIYLQDEDGNIVYIEDPTAPGPRYTGIGSGSSGLNISGTPCGEQVV